MKKAGLFNPTLMAFVMVGFMMAIAAEGADLRFSRYYSDGLVLQRDKPNFIRGVSEANSKVTLQFGGQSVSCVSDASGHWEATLAPMAANAVGQKLIATTSSGNTRCEIENVLIGDVFLVALQSSIDVSLGRDEAGRRAAADAGESAFNVINIKTIPSVEPQADLLEEATTGWLVTSEQVALKMNATAYYFAKGLAQISDVPVGVVDIDMGAYFPIAWMSRDDLLQTGDVMPKDTGKDLYQANNAVEAQVESQTLALYKYQTGEGQKEIDAQQAKAVEDAAKKGIKAPDAPVAPPNPLADPRFPAAGYNAVLHPLRGVALKGVLLQLGNNYFYTLYQKIMREGEGLSRGHLGWAWKHNYDLRKWGIYLEPWTIPRIVPQWRQYFQDAELPVGWILPPASDLGTMADHHREVRELLRGIAGNLENVGLIHPGNGNIPFSAQPADDKLVAERSLAWAKGVVYGDKDVIASGPLFDRLEPHYSTVSIFFKPGTADGLTAASGALDYFEVAGSDAAYSPAKAKIEGDTVVLRSDLVNAIVHVRYNWQRKPDLGLTNKAGLPAIPFRTDALTPIFKPLTGKFKVESVPLRYMP